MTKQVHLFQWRASLVFGVALLSSVAVFPGWNIARADSLQLCRPWKVGWAAVVKRGDTGEIQSYRVKARQMRAACPDLLQRIDAYRPKPPKVAQPKKDPPPKVAQPDEDVPAKGLYVLKMSEPAPFLPQREERVSWDVGLTTCAVDSEQAKQLQTFLKEELGFTSIRNLDERSARVSWIAPRNTVFYYRRESHKVALAVAQELRTKFGFGFRVTKGAGLGLQTGWESRTLFVHVVSTAC